MKNLIAFFLLFSATCFAVDTTPSYSGINITGTTGNVPTLTGMNNLTNKTVNGVTLAGSGTLNTGTGGTLQDSAFTASSAMPVSTAQAAAITSATNSAASDATAKANAVQAFAIQRSNHTGTQLMNTISDAGNAATKSTGTTAGTVAAGDDSRITGAAQKSANLSDLGNFTTARANLSLTIGTNVQAWSANLDTLATGMNGVRSLLSSGTGTLDLSGYTVSLPTMTIIMKHDTYSALQTVVLANSELGVDTDYRRLFVGDGSTAGGVGVNGFTILTGTSSDPTTYTFNTPLTCDMAILSGSTSTTARWDSLILKSGSSLIPIVARGYTSTTDVSPSYSTNGVIFIPTINSGTGANGNHSTSIISSLTAYNSVSGGSASTTGTGGSPTGSFPGMIVGSGGNGGASTGAGNGGNSTVSQPANAIINLILGNGGSASSGGNGGNGGTVSSYPIILTCGNGGAGGTTANGGNGGFAAKLVSAVGGVGGAAGSGTGANGGNGGNGGTTSFNQASLTFTGGAGGAGGTGTNATGGNGGQQGSKQPLIFKGGAGGAGGTYAGGNGGSYGYWNAVGGAGGAGSGSSAGGAGGNGGYFENAGGAGSTSGGAGGNGGAFVSTGGDASDGVNGAAGGILTLSASGASAANGTIAWAGGLTTTIPAITGTAGIRVAIPATSATSGAAGQWSSDDTYFYYYGATGWRRISGSSF